MPNIPYPLTVIDTEGRMTPEFQRWLTQITNTDIIIGTGSPEGVVEATIGREYMDDSGVAGAIKYIKRDADIGGDASQGWILV